LTSSVRENDIHNSPKNVLAVDHVTRVSTQHTHTLSISVSILRIVWNLH